MSELVRLPKSTRGYKSFRKGGKNLRKNVKRLLLARRLHKETPVFIFQMGKVASSSIYHSLKQQYPGAVAHAHHIGNDNWSSILFYDWFKSGKPLKIISPVREPIGRNISDFFQLLEDFTEKKSDSSKPGTKELIDAFISNYTHDLPLTWFDNNIKKHFNINIFDSPFPKTGVATYSLNNVSLLTFRVDLDDRLKEKAIRDFLGFKSFKLNNRNVSTNKEYYDSYKTFINTIKLSDNYLSTMKNSKYFNYFYTSDEIEKIISKWK